ncbi:amidohydrolase family protein [Chitinophaga sp.]|uniref:amidohydrolase family protein n=1 Tax=Chitinophaga sp. TaxID=1869181 RepID=UPI0031E24528
MRIITLEEHVSFPEMFISTSTAAAQHMQAKLADITGERLSSMQATGITMQVLSIENTDVPSPAYASAYNDLVADKIKDHRESFTAFALLPMTTPAAAADELERTVKTYGFQGAMIRGTINGKFLDAPEFAPVFERAEKLDVPLYLHPGVPPQAVIDAYYSNIGGTTGPNEAIACYGWGWHSETAIHILRLFAAGIFDKYPNLKIIIGHMGEMLPMMWTRMNRIFSQGKRSLIDTFREQLFITTSGIFTQPQLQLAIDTIGIDNILFSIDYPFSSNEMGIDFLNNIRLPAEQVAKIAHGNADRLLRLK